VARRKGERWKTPEWGMQERTRVAADGEYRTTIHVLPYNNIAPQRINRRSAQGAGVLNTLPPINHWTAPVSLFTKSEPA